MIPQTFIDELIARTDIVEVIGLRVQLKKAGREFKACCPFHGEKTPSFWVSPDKQFYHCFGCGAHGTVIRFLMEHDRMAFPEAVEELATRLGLEIPHQGGAPGGGPRRADESLYDLMSRVSQFYVDSLARDERAREYVAKRGLDRNTVEQFAIGYAPNSWNDVLRRFGTDDAARRQLTELGLIVERDRGQIRDGERHYDRFRDRIMFPIRDVRGRIIAFGGRIIDQGEPKYLNSPETVLFHKGRELYGLYETRRTRSNLKRLLIVEGYMDAVSLHQAGVNYAVATLGTSTTPDHFKRIFRLVSEVAFAFDGDRAGRAAAWRALQHALPEARDGREIRFLFLPDGHDPDTLVAEEGQVAFEKRLDATLPLSRYLVDELARQTGDLSHADGRARFGELLRPSLGKLPEGIYREQVEKELARMLGITVERLREAMDLAPPPPTALAAEAAAGQPARAAGRTRLAAGRGSFVRQVLARLLHFPAIAQQVTAEEREGLEACNAAGIELVRAVLDDLRERPAQLAAQVIQRWADKPEGEWLQKLLGREEVIGDATAAATELHAALHKLADTVALERLKELEEKSRWGRLGADELMEFQRLMSIQIARGAHGGRS
jgi:DNA primase